MTGKTKRTPRGRKRGGVRAILSLLLVATMLSPAGAAELPSIDLTSFTLEELLHLEITSVARKPQKLSDAAAAVFVITQEDLRRSGVTSIPEALRMAPGVQVARIDASKWAVSARGFNGRFANKLLVLIDGRSVYTPLFSGVYWDVQDLLLEDVERIEVIRGPGATLWGANAVNGVINIITRRTSDTQGTLVTVGGGTEERAFTGLRQGGSLGEDGAWRIYAKAQERDDAEGRGGLDGDDDWTSVRGGFRLDWSGAGKDQFTLQGDAYDGRAGQTSAEPVLAPPYLRIFEDETDFAGGNLLGRWERTLSATSELTLQAYYDRTERDDVLIREKRDTADLDFQHHFALGERQEIVWGLGYRLSIDELRDGVTTSFDDRRRHDQLFSAFLQDDISLVPERLRLTLGSKFEHNDYTGLEVQPNARLLWNPAPGHSAWASVSRAVRTPSRAENDAAIRLLTVPPSLFVPLPTALNVQGDSDYDAESLIAYELGYRVGMGEKAALDLALFYNDYKDLRFGPTVTPTLAFIPSPHLVLPLVIDNDLDGETYGAEVALDWRPLDWWQLRGAYTYLEEDFDLPDAIPTEVIGFVRGFDPRHQVSVRSGMDWRQFEFDLWWRWVDALRGAGVDDYQSLDVRLGWRPAPAWELSLVGQNLLEESHLEFVPEFGTLATEVERGVYGKVAWRF